MINIVGGTYHERCREPYWDELFGSGLRAAAALSGLSEKVRLTTYIGIDHEITLRAYALEYGVDVDAKSLQHTLQFSYEHPLHRPFIDPPLHLISPGAPLEVEASVVLRFGMLDGDAVVRGERVVYDPQSAYQPQPFGANGSTAGALAIVTNYREGSLLTQAKDVDVIGRTLLQEHGAAVVLIKSGALGVRIYEGDQIYTVPAFRAASVFPIGSGDVFSAVFTHYWGERQLSAFDAAEHASRATAWYCQSRRLPIPNAETVRSVIVEPIKPSSDARYSRMIYLAGPFFTTAERWLVNEARNAFDQHGVRVFSPYHDVGMGPASAVVEKDIAALQSSDAVFAICDHFDPGTTFEVGYAVARGIPVVAFVQNEPEEPLKMLVGTGCEIVDEFVSAIYRASWAALER